MTLCFSFCPCQVSLLEYRKRQREARRSGSKTECSSPVSTMLPLTVETFPVAQEIASEPPPPPPAPTPPCNTLPVKEPQTSEEAEAPGEKGEQEGGEGQWYVNYSSAYEFRVVSLLFIVPFRPGVPNTSIAKVVWVNRMALKKNKLAYHPSLLWHVPLD